MKKVLAFVLALAMVLGCFSTVFAKEFTDVAADADYAAAVDVLSDLGVVSGYGDDYKPAGIVTRAEMASLLVKALGLTPSGSTTTKFTDVKSTDWFAGWVAYANSLGIIAGRTETTFDPQAPVSYDEAIVMIINALGYSGSLKGTYPTAYIIKAQSLGITDDVTLLGTEGATRGDIAQLIYNTLDCKIGSVDEDGKWTADTEKSTMFERLGAIVADEAILVDEEVLADAAIDLSEYFGAMIVPVLNDDKEVIAISSVKTEFVTLDDFDADDFTSNWTVVSPASVFVNGEFDDYFDAADVVALDGEVTFAVVKSGAKIKTVYSAQYWVAEDTFRVEDIDAFLEELKDDQTITGPSDTYKFKMTAEDDDVIDTDSFILVGAASLEEIAEDSVLTVYEGASYLKKIEVSTKTVEGSVDRISGSYYTIDGNKYKKAADATSETTLALGDEGTFFLNYAGKIFDFEGVTDDGDWLFGVVLATASETARYSSTANEFVKMYTADGVVEYELDTDYVTLGAITTYKLTSYQLDDDGLICAVDSATDLAYDEITSATPVSAKGVIAGATLADDIVIIVNTEDETKAAKYSVAKKADYLGKTIEEAYVFYNGDYEVVAAFICDVKADSEETDVLALVTDITALNADKYDYDYEVVALYDGEVKTFYTDLTTLEEVTTTSAISKNYQTFTLTSDGEITDVTPATASAYKTADGTTDKVTVSGSVLKIGGYAVTLADDVIVYVYDADADDVWSVGKLSATYKVGSYAKMALLDLDTTADGEYDVVVVIK